jgi:hypothetical protein
MNECRAEIVSGILSVGTGLYLLGGLWKLELSVRYCPGQVGHPGKARHCPLGLDVVRWEVAGNTFSSENCPISSQI